MYSIGRWNDNDERSRAFSDRNVTENGATQTKQRAKQEKLKQYETFVQRYFYELELRKKENQPIYEAERRSTRALENDYKSIEIIE